MRDFKGSKYESGLSHSEIAKKVKAEIENKYPYMVISVRTKSFAGGGSIDGTIKDFGFNPFTPEYEQFLSEGGKTSQWVDDYNNTKPMFTKDSINIEKECKAILQAYNYDDSDPMTDYFNVNFYGNFDIDTINLKKLYLPESKEVQETFTDEKKYSERDDIYKKIKQERLQKALYKYGDIVICRVYWVGNKQTDEFAIVTKTPNGEARVNDLYDVTVLKPIEDLSEVQQLIKRQDEVNNGWGKSRRKKAITLIYIEGKPYKRSTTYIENCSPERLKPYEGNWTHWLKEEEAKKNQPKPAKEPKPTPAPKVSVAQPAKATEVQTTNQDVTIRRNEKLKGIEILFGKFPSDETRNYIKSLGFKWNSNQKLWYTNFSETTFKKVNEKFGPGEAPNKAFIMARAKAKLKLLALKF